MQDVLVVGKALDEAESQKRKTELDRMAAMLSRLGGRGYQVRESEEAYAAGEEEVDTDPDSDSDLDETKAQNGAIHWIGVLDGNDPGGGSVPFIHDDVLPPDTSIGVHTHGNDREYYYVEWGAIMPRCALPLNRDKWRGASGNAGSNAARWPVVYAQHGCAGEPDRGDPGAECGARRNGRAYPGDGDGVPGGRRRRLAGWKDHVGLQLARAPVRGPEDRAIRDYAKACHKRYGDDVTFIPGAFFSNAYNSREPINQKQTRPQDNPVPLDALAEADRQLIGRYYPDLEP